MRKEENMTKLNEFRLHDHNSKTNKSYYADRQGKLVEIKSTYSAAEDQNFYDNFVLDKNQKKLKSDELIDEWVKFTKDDYTYLNTYTFKNRKNRWTGDYDIPPSEEFVKNSMRDMEEQFLNRSTWYGDLSSRMFTTLEVGEQNGRLHLHSLVKNEKTKNKKENWLWSFNSHWSDNYGYYDSKSIDKNTGAVVREYILKANRYVHKDNNTFNGHHFPHFWDWGTDWLK